MPTFDFNQLTQDLQLLEQRLQQFGAQPVLSEQSLNQLFCQHLASGGGRTRAMLALAAGQTIGLPDPVRFSIASAVELLHQASLVHDDIQDRDPVRRGQVSVWKSAGESAAICLGDNLIAAAFESLTDLPEPFSHQLPRLVVMLSRGVSVMAAGQTLDCQWTPETPMSFADYEHIVRHKSGPLLGLPIALTLAVNGGDDNQVARILHGASSIGVAYQLADDFVDREEDRGTRLNGYWVISAHEGCEQDAEYRLRARFEWHLEQARASVASLPTFCIDAFNVLIDALQHKYPSLQAAA